MEKKKQKIAILKRLIDLNKQYQSLVKYYQEFRMAKYINVLTHKDGNKLGKRKYIINLIKWCKKAKVIS